MEGMSRFRFPTREALELPPAGGVGAQGTVSFGGRICDGEGEGGVCEAVV